MGFHPLYAVGADQCVVLGINRLLYDEPPNLDGDNELRQTVVRAQLGGPAQCTTGRAFESQIPKLTIGDVLDEKLRLAAVAVAIRPLWIVPADDRRVTHLNQNASNRVVRRVEASLCRGH